MARRARVHASGQRKDLLPRVSARADNGASTMVVCSSLRRFGLSESAPGWPSSPKDARLNLQESRRRYFEALDRERAYSWHEAGYWSFYLDFLFDGFDFSGKRVLDIGGGAGDLSIYAGALGAREAVCLEPEAAGSTAEVTELLAGPREVLGLTDRVVIRGDTFQEFEDSGDGFDIVLLHNSINHLDEEACIHLKDRPEAESTYVRLFEKLARISRPGARLLLTDCSRYNAFALLGLRNPLLRTIEWHKHQSPYTWRRLLARAGFTRFRIRWLPVRRLGKPGRILLGNVLGTYFLHSAFCLTAERAAGS